MDLMFRRYICNDGDSNCYDNTSPWYNWGRWVALGVIVAAALIVFLIVAFSNARRRRNRGFQPYYGTAWMAPPPYPPPPMHPVYAEPQAQAPPPVYTPHPPAYFGGQPTVAGGAPGAPGGFEMQPPPNVYHGGDRVYQSSPAYPKNGMV